MNFALFFGNRGFFPGSLVDAARKEMIEAVKQSGNDCIFLDPQETKYGAVSCESDGLIFAEWLEKHRHKVDGVIMCLPNFSDESGAAKALRNWGGPILIQAYPDQEGHMGPAERRDSYCGKISICNYFNQCGIKYTVFKPHVISPTDPVFVEQIKKFASVCRVVNGARKINIGAIGSRVTAFKTVRFDEVTMEKNNVTVETIDLSELFHRVDQINDNDPSTLETVSKLENYSNMKTVPQDRKIAFAKVILAILYYVDKYKFDALAIRCWNEFPENRKISVCLVSAYLNSLGIPTTCEVDLGNALMMKLLSLSSNSPSTLMDWNNNYQNDENKVILFHCGPTANELMCSSRIEKHAMFEKSFGQNCSWGVNVGRLKPGPITYACLKTRNGKIGMYLGEAEITDETVEKEYFGTYGIGKFDNLEDIIMYVIKNDFHHHVSYTLGKWKDVLEEATRNYLGWEVKAF